MSLSPIIETAVLKQSEETLRELAQAFHNVGITKPQIAMMLRAVADEYAPPIMIEHQTVQ